MLFAEEKQCQTCSINYRKCKIKYSDYSSKKVRITVAQKENEPISLESCEILRDECYKKHKCKKQAISEDVILEVKENKDQ